MRNSGHLRLRSRLASTALGIAFLVMLPVHVLGQISGGAIRGIITDSSGAVIQGAAVTLVQAGTGETRKLASNSAGLYDARNLPIGTYALTVTATGFSTKELTRVELQVGSERVVDVELALGGTEQTVTATEEAASVDLATSQTGGIATGEVVRGLPLNGRDWTALAALQPGVSIVRTENPVVLDVPRGNRGYGVMMAVSGSRPQQSGYWVDGINVNDYAGGASASVLGASLGVDAVEEFSVITANPPVDYGKASGGVINAVTRAGTNRIHGSAYEFLRNSALDARNFFDPSTLPPFKRNQFGGSLGGPVKRRRTFFFVNFEGVRQGLGVTDVDTVPSAGARAGVLSSGNVAVSPRVVPYLAFFPLPNGPVKGDAGIYTFSAQNYTDENFVTTRMDHVFSEKDTIHGTYLFDQGATTGPDVYDGVLLGTFTRRQTASLEETHILSPWTLNFLRAGVNRVVAEQVQSLSAINLLAADPAYGFLPGRSIGQIQIAGITEYPGGLYATGDYHFHYTSYQLYDDLSMTRGSHSIRTGVAVEAIRSNTLGAGTNNGAANFGSLASFLTDQPSSFTATIPGTNMPIGLRQVVAGVYIKDEWRALRNLTVNFGLRYETATVPTEEHNQLATLTFESQQLKVGAPFFQNPTHRDFAPVVGAAWDPLGDKKTVVHASFGQYDVPPLTSLFSLIAILSAPFNLQGSSTKLPAGSFPNGLYQSLAAGGPRAEFIQQSPKRSYMLQWNLAIQHEFTPTVTVEAGYTGSHGVHLPLIENDINTVLPTSVSSSGYFWPVPAGSGTKPWPGWGNVTGVLWPDSSVYDALNARVQRRFRHGLLAQVSYTWSKSLDSGSNSLPTAYTNTVSNLPYFDPRLRRSVSDFDVPQMLVGSGTWEMPGLRRQRSLATWILSGWQLGTLLQLNSGLPFTPTIAGDPLGLNSSQRYDFPDRLNLPGCGNPVNPGNATDYIKLSCFAAPSPANRLGDAGRNVARGPGLIDWDTSLFKNISFARLSDSFRIQFRFEMFNALNHTNFNPPTAASLQLFAQALTPIASAGNLTSTSTTSRQLQFAIKVLW